MKRTEYLQIFSLEAQGTIQATGRKTWKKVQPEVMYGPTKEDI